MSVNSVKGFRLTDGSTAKYDYAYLENIITDKQLTQEDVAADGKAVGDAIGELEAELSDVKADLGDLSELETTDKSNLVSAINEAAQSGGSGTGLTEDMKQALLACFNNVAWKEDDDGELIDALEEALYPQQILQE